MHTERKKNLFGIFVHKWLRIPYSLHVRHIHRTKGTKSTILFIHGLGATGKMWEPAIKKLPQHVNYISVDLLGFGRSPSPYWETYDARMQARALRTTLVRHGFSGPVTIVGHSLGALVAIEYAKSYPRSAKSLILCSPPIYRHNNDHSRVSPEKVLRTFYEKLLKSPTLLMRLYNLGRSTKIDPSLELNKENLEMFIASMRAGIINQTAIDDITKLTLPITIIHGLLDPLVIRSNLTQLTKRAPNITLTTIAASHPLNKAYIRQILDVINSHPAWPQKG